MYIGIKLCVEMKQGDDLRTRRDLFIKERSSVREDERRPEQITHSKPS